MWKIINYANALFLLSEMREVNEEKDHSLLALKRVLFFSYSAILRPYDHVHGYENVLL